MSKKANKKEDTLSQLKKQEDKLKKNKKVEEEEENSEEDEVDNDQNVVKQQTVQKTEKPKNLKDLLGGGDNKPKPKPKKKESKIKNKYEEPKKLTFTNKNKTGNGEKVYEKITENNPKMNYEIKEEKKTYKDVDEDVAKPQFTTKVDESKKFVELNKNEDVRKIFFYFYCFFHRFSYLLEIWLVEN